MSKKLNKKKLIQELEKKGAVKPCHRCGKENFSIAEGYSFAGLIEVPTQISLGGPFIPTFLVICNNCGAITPHALGAYMKLEENEDSEEESD